MSCWSIYVDEDNGEMDSGGKGLERKAEVGREIEEMARESGCYKPDEPAILVAEGQALRRPPPTYFKIS